MIHFFPELAALYHRSLLISLDISGKNRMWDEWTREIWNFSPEKTSYYSKKPENLNGPISGFCSAALGKRNKDRQMLLSFSSSLEELIGKDQALECCDSLLIEVEPSSTSTNLLFQWQGGPIFRSKKVLWCMRSPFGAESSLHEKALDKRMAELAPDSQRILWPKGQFIRDGLEWMLSF
jgi:hypothetical protein